MRADIQRALKPTLLVADSGPLIVLAVANVLPQTIGLYKTLWVPQAVVDECTATPHAPGATAIRAALGGKRPGLTLIAESEIAPLDPAYAQGLGSGEVAVLAYAAQHGYIALIDDRRARTIARRLNIVTVGSGTVLLALKANGRIDSIRPALEAWQAHGYFVAPAIVGELLRRAGEA